MSVIRNPSSNILVTGGAGFIGSHLVDRLLEDGHRVTVVDNLLTGKLENLRGAKKHQNFKFIEAEVTEWAREQVDNSGEKFDQIYHLASPASPVWYFKYPEETYWVNAVGTHYLCQLAQKTGSRLLYTSTSEVYGDPLEHPQKESYFGNVNPVGPRAAYDEAKRFGEMVISTYWRRFDSDFRIVRVFNTYGPRMDADDGRLMPGLINQSLRGEALTVHGSGGQTRSFCYVSDLVEYLVRVMETEEAKGKVINIGNAEEHSIIDVAKMIQRMTGTGSQIEHQEAREEDPERRRPALHLAIELLGYQPQVPLYEGLLKTIEWFRGASND